VGGTDLATRKVLETRHGIRFKQNQLPDASTAVSHRVERQARQIREAMGSLVFESYLPTVKALRDRPDGDALLAAALRAFFQWDRQRRSAMSDVDSIGDLIQQRNEKLERKTRRDGDRDRGGRDKRGRDRGDRDRDRGDRGDRAPSLPARAPRQRSRANTDDLDALLISGDGAPSASSSPADELSDALLVAEPASAEADRKKRRRRRRRGHDEEGGEGTDDAAAPHDALDELDALLTTD
jgi:hypothetical protein